jgi:hypothetical protein
LSRPARVLIFALLLVPSAQYAWRNRDMPGFARLHDDGLLFLSAKSMAAGEGYRIPSLPENPYQTKYPPLYPLFLSAVWKLDPRFPANLALAAAFSWGLLAACLALAWALYRSGGFSEKQTWILVAMLGVCPYMILFGTRPFSEIFFTCLLLATFLVARRHGWRMAALAGALAGCAYLSRTAGVALLVAIPAWYALRRDFRRAVIFVFAMLPFVVGWSLWTRAHTLQGAGDDMLYYTDYVRFQFLNVGWNNIAVVAWKNLDQLLYAFGSLAIPQVVALGPVKTLTQVVGIAAISGIVRMARRGIAVDYALFAMISSAMLVVWHFPPNERFILPLFPLIAAGLVTELDFLFTALRKGFRNQDAGQRGAAYVLASVAGLVIVAGLGLQMFVSFGYLNRLAEEDRVKLRDLRSAYEWIDANVAAEAKILSSDDPLLYAYTGRRGNAMPLLPKWWYRDDHEHIVDAFREAAEYCRRRGFDYFYATSDDLARWTGAEDQVKVDAVVHANRELSPVFSGVNGVLYRVSPGKEKLVTNEHE